MQELRFRTFRDGVFHCNNGVNNMRVRRQLISKHKDFRSTDSVNEVNYSLSDCLTHTMRDYRLRPKTNSVWVLPPTGPTLADHYIDNNPFKEILHIKKELKVEAVITTVSKSTLYYDAVITFEGLPTECRNYWSYNQYQLGIPDEYRIPSDYAVDFGVYMGGFQKMNKDSSLLNLHDQNLFTSIGELKDFKKTIQTVTRHKFDNKYAADKYLGVNFGILPFYSDVKNYIDNWNNFAPNLKKWNELGKDGKVLNKHRTVFKKKVDGIATSLYSGTYQWPGGNSYRYRFEYETDYEISAKTHMYFKTMPLESNNKLELIASLNGLKQPISAVWNLIPFSFVVDWFTNTGDLIEQFERTEPVLKYDIVSAGYSLKVKQKGKCHVYHVDSSTGAEVYLGFSKRDVAYYTRKPIAISDLMNNMFNQKVVSPFDFNTELSGYQWSLAAALAVTLTKK